MKRHRLLSLLEMLAAKGIDVLARGLRAGARGAASAAALLRRHARGSDTLAGRILTGIVLALAGVAALVAVLAVLVRVAGLPLGFASPWVSRLIEERSGGQIRAEIGSIRFEYNDADNASLMVRELVLRGSDGAQVFSAPLAEIGIDPAALFAGSIEPKRLNLIGPTLLAAIDASGQISVSSGGKEIRLGTVVQKEAVNGPIPPPPFVNPGTGGERADAGTAPAPVPPPPALSSERAVQAILRPLADWFERIDRAGFDGNSLIELGLRKASLTFTDARIGSDWTIAPIDLRISKPQEGGLAFSLTAQGGQGPWSLNASISGLNDNERAIELVARDISPRDLLAPLGLADVGKIEGVPLSAILRARLSGEGLAISAEGRINVGAGRLGPADTDSDRLDIVDGTMAIRWEPARRAVIVEPFQLLTKTGRFTLVGMAEAPETEDAPWKISIPAGQIVASPDGKESPVVLDRVLLRGSFDPARKHLQLEHGELSGRTAGVALSGGIDFDRKGRLMLGVAGSRMTVSALKALWPAPAAPGARAWVVHNLSGGIVEKATVAINMPMEVIVGPDIQSDNDLLVEAEASSITGRLLDTLPPLRDGVATVRVTGRTAQVNVASAVMDMSQGRRLLLSNGSFSMPDHSRKPPDARIRLKAEGSVEAVGELMNMEPLTGALGSSVDLAGARGQVSATVTLNLPLLKSIARRDVDYQVEAELTGLAGDQLLAGRKVEQGNLKVNASPGQVSVNGNMRFAGAPATLDYRRAQDGMRDMRLAATLDDGARARLGADLGAMLTGAVPVRFLLHGPESDARLHVEADLTAAKVNDLVPGWSKPAGKAARANFVLIEKPNGTRLEDITLEGGGLTVKGMLEVDASGVPIQANLPTFHMAETDKASVKLDRAGDGTLRVQMRGDLIDGRGLVRSLFAGPTESRNRAKSRDVELDLKLGTVVGNAGETMRALDVRLSRKGGTIRAFNLSGRVGREASVTGDLRGEGKKAILFFEGEDAGALARFLDIYGRVEGGTFWLVIDAPTSDEKPQDGILSIREFSVRGEQAIERALRNAPEGAVDRTARQQATLTPFTKTRIDFTRTPARLDIREGVIWGPSIGATMEGQLDYTRDEVKVRGTLVPAYGLNNLFARIPLLGAILGGGEYEGLFGLTYEVSGASKNPTLRINPISAVAPGFLRKIFEFRSADDKVPVQPQR